MDIAGAIFDADGTLLDSTGMWQGLGENYFEYLGGTSRPGVKESLGPMGIGAAALYYKTRYGGNQSLQEIKSDIYKMLEHFYFKEARLKPHAREVVHKLHKDGVKMCIATATPKALVEGALKRLGVRACFGDIFSSADFGTNKGNPAFFEMVGTSLGTPKAQTWVFDDALYAVESAKHAGFHVAGVYDPRETMPDEVRGCADLYLRDLSDFPS